MKTYIALLRGINVSGHKLIKMADLKCYLEEIDFKNIKTYIQSGNVIFDYDDVRSEFLEQKIKTKILEKYGFEVPVIIIDPIELKSVIAKNPFINLTEKVYVVFLSNKPSTENIEQLQQVDYSAEKFNIVDKAIYLYMPNGNAKSKLTINFFEKKLKVNATSRNWNTINKLLEITENR